MTPQAALIELLERVGATLGADVFVNEDELRQWPSAAVAAMKSQKLIAKARPASSVICPGCERECAMPVYTAPAATGSPAPFIVCDKRSDINRVAVSLSALEQWKTTGEMIAAMLAQMLGISRANSVAGDGREWSIGLLEGKKHKGRVRLEARDGLNIRLAGHTVPLIEVLTINDDALALDKRALVRLVDKPADGSEIETPEQRRERLRARIDEEKAKGTRAFLKLVAAEEGISPSRVKQITSTSRSVSSLWPGVTNPRKKRPSSKTPKPSN